MDVAKIDIESWFDVVVDALCKSAASLSKQSIAEHYDTLLKSTIGDDMWKMCNILLNCEWKNSREIQLLASNLLELIDSLIKTMSQNKGRRFADVDQEYLMSCYQWLQNIPTVSNPMDCMFIHVPNIIPKPTMPLRRKLKKRKDRDSHAPNRIIRASFSDLSSENRQKISLCAVKCQRKKILRCNPMMDDSDGLPCFEPISLANFDICSMPPTDSTPLDPLLLEILFSQLDCPLKSSPVFVEVWIGVLIALLTKSTSYISKDENFLSIMVSKICNTISLDQDDDDSESKDNFLNLKFSLLFTPQYLLLVEKSFLLMIPRIDRTVVENYISKTILRLSNLNFFLNNAYGGSMDNNFLIINGDETIEFCLEEAFLLLKHVFTLVPIILDPTTAEKRTITANIVEWSKFFINCLAKNHFEDIFYSIFVGLDLLSSIDYYHFCSTHVHNDSENAYLTKIHSLLDDIDIVLVMLENVNKGRHHHEMNQEVCTFHESACPILFFNNMIINGFSTVKDPRLKERCLTFCARRTYCRCSNSLIHLNNLLKMLDIFADISQAKRLFTSYQQYFDSCHVAEIDADIIQSIVQKVQKFLYASAAVAGNDNRSCCDLLLRFLIINRKKLPTVFNRKVLKIISQFLTYILSTKRNFDEKNSRKLIKRGLKYCAMNFEFADAEIHKYCIEVIIGSRVVISNHEMKQVSLITNINSFVCEKLFVMAKLAASDFASILSDRAKFYAEFLRLIIELSTFLRENNEFYRNFFDKQRGSKVSNILFMSCFEFLQSLNKNKDIEHESDVKMMTRFNKLLSAVTKSMIIFRPTIELKPALKFARDVLNECASAITVSVALNFINVAFSQSWYHWPKAVCSQDGPRVWFDNAPDELSASADDEESSMEVSIRGENTISSDKLAIDHFHGRLTLIRSVLQLFATNAMCPDLMQGFVSFLHIAYSRKNTAFFSDDVKGKLNKLAHLPNFMDLEVLQRLPVNFQKDVFLSFFECLNYHFAKNIVEPSNCLVFPIVARKKRSVEISTTEDTNIDETICCQNFRSGRSSSCCDLSAAAPVRNQDRYSTVEKPTFKQSGFGPWLRSNITSLLSLPGI
uniref:Uncharacterized protein n=1 Tax=Romanomermis culicivorax TaxID=13658 RepID=A0A915KXJ4_ROMCU